MQQMRAMVLTGRLTRRGRIRIWNCSSGRKTWSSGCSNESSGDRRDLDAKVLSR